MNINRNCPFYHNHVKDIDHMFIHCLLVNEIWTTLKYCHTPIKSDPHFIHWIDNIWKILVS